MVTDTGQFFRALKITRACLMMLEDIVAEDLSRMQNRHGVTLLNTTYCISDLACFFFFFFF